MCSCAGCYPDIASMEYCFDHCKRLLHQGTRPVDRLVSALLLEGKRVISDSAVHGLVHGCPGLHAEISLVAVDCFSTSSNTSSRSSPPPERTGSFGSRATSSG